jgi:hypothetical protein
VPGGRLRKGGSQCAPGRQHCNCAERARVRGPHDGIAPGVGNEVTLALPDQADGIAVDVGAVRIGRGLVGQNVGEQRGLTVLELAADQRTQQGAVGTEGAAEIVAASEPDTQHELLAASERNI